MKVLLTAALIFSAMNICAQEKDFGSWNTINTEITISKHWEAFQELQLRSQSFYDNFYYYEIKGGLGYVINKNFSFLLGIGKYVTYDDPGSFTKPITRNETRFWQQITMRHYLDRIKFEHRYRFENRWFQNSGFQNRIRYRLNASIPLNHKKMDPRTAYFGVFNEVFLTPKEPYFARNRFSPYFGYQINELFAIQPGYVYQFDYSPAKKLGKHFFNMTLLFDINAEKRTIRRIHTVD